MVTQVDQTKPVLGPELGELTSQAAQVVAAAERAVKQQRELGSVWLTDQRMGKSEGHTRF